MRLRVLAAVVLALPLLPSLGSAASAHPLGNFSVNRYSRIEVAPDRVTVRYVLDLAEIPTLQDLTAAGLPADAPDDTISRATLGPRADRIRSALRLIVDGDAAALEIADASLSLPEGQAGLRTMRIALTLVAPLRVRDGAAIEYRDGNEAGRSGWHEIVLRGTGVALSESTAPDHDRSDELRRYPDDPTASPPNDDRASARIHLSARATSETTPLAAVATTARFAIDRSADQLTAFLRRGPGTDLGALLAALAVAAFLGALHALGPGHGKSIVGAYLVGSRGTALHAVLLGGTVTATHTAGVYALALLTLLAAPYVLPERLYPILGVLSGLLVVGIGLSMAWSRMRRLRGHAHSHADAGDHHHEHAHGHAHAHAAGAASLRSVLALGVSGGLLPCPTALVVLLAAISFHNTALGMALVAAFSLGLAAVLTGIGLLMVGGGRALARSGAAATLRSWRIVRLVPALSAVAVAIAGVVIALDAARALG